MKCLCQLSTKNATRISQYIVSRLCEIPITTFSYTIGGWGGCMQNLKENLRSFSNKGWMFDNSLQSRHF
jgi:hypothetical protein